MIAYFFLGPLFLLVPRDTPFWEEYVRGHAKRATSIISIGVLVIILYITLLAPLIQVQIFSISLDSMILAVMMIIFSIQLIHGAYRAYNGIDARSIHTLNINIDNDYTIGNYSEEEKIRILASFIPFLGIFIAKRYPTEPYTIGKKVGGALAFILITLIVFYGGAVSTLVFALTIVAVVVFIMTAVYLFLHGEFLSLGIYKYIPTYTSIEAHISASILSLFDFFRVAFGGDKRRSYSDIYREKYMLYSQTATPETPYILPSWIIWVPVLNLITLPSLTMSRMSIYRPLILQWLLITILLILIVIFYWLQSSIGLYLLFPSLTLIAYSWKNTNIRAPLTSWIVSLSSLFTRGQEKVQKMWEQKEEVSFKYEEK
jgi:hypothetical protein